MSRSPVSVRKSSTSSISSQNGVIASASPPVAMAVASSPSSSRMRLTMPSTQPAKPYTTPDLTAAKVSRPIVAQLQAAQLEQADQQRGQLTAGGLADGGEPPVLDQLVPAEHPDVRLGVAEVDGEEHGPRRIWLVAAARPDPRRRAPSPSPTRS